VSRRRFQRRSALDVWSMNFGPSMTPMVDVVLVILIFFMASASFVGPEWFLRAALPVLGGGDEPDEVFFDLPPAEFNVQLTLGDDGLTRVTGFGAQGTTVGSFRSLVFEEMSRLSADSVIVLIDPDPNVTYNDVVQVHEACLAAGAERVGIR